MTNGTRVPHVCAAALSLTLAADVHAAEPTLKWAYRAQGTLYAPPLVADVHPSPGRETIIADAEVRTLRCIDATGKQIWAYRGGWRTRLTSAASLSETARPGRHTLVIGGSDGKLCCLDAETGKEHWSGQVGGITWGSATWVDLDGDGRDEIIAGTEHAVIALDATGKERWAYRRAKGAPPLEIGAPLAACDVDGDGRPELFGSDRCGLFCLDAAGAVRWERLTGAGGSVAVVIVDADRDGRPELYGSRETEPAIIALEPLTGKARWTFPTLADPAGIAAGDVDRDGAEEIIAADNDGHVYALEHDGKLIWSYRTAQRTQAAVSLGDVDGDDDIETLVTSWDHGLYCLDSAGGLEWRYAADRRVLDIATISDVDGDGKTDILFGGSDHVLRCITLGGAYNPALTPWPARQLDVAQSGAAFPRTLRPTIAAIAETRSLLPNGGFERAHQVDKPDRYPKGSGIRERRLRQPRGWHVEPTSADGWALDPKTVRSGKQSVRVSKPMRLATAPVAIERTVRALTAVAYGKGVGAAGAALRWSGALGTLREDVLKRIDGEKGWHRFALTGAIPPAGASRVELICNTAAGGASWDDADITVALHLPPKVQVLANQVGYDVGAPKRFTVQSNVAAQTARFVVVTDDGQRVHTGTLQRRGRVKGRYGHDWGYEFYRGDFSGLDRPGRYRIEVTLSLPDDLAKRAGTATLTDLSWPFEIGPDLLWSRTARPAYRFFYYQRCGAAVPGFHEACHLDDGLMFDGAWVNLSGGWHDAGDYNTYHNAPYVFGLARAYGIAKAAFDRQDADGNGRADMLDEVLWGADHSRRMIAPDGSAFGQITSGYGFWAQPEIETDNKPNTGDERPVQPPKNGVDSSVHHAAMAKIARYASDREPWLDAAERGLRWALAAKKRGVYQFSTAVDLYAATHDEEYAKLARELFPKITADETVIHAVRAYDGLLGADHTAAIRKALVDWAEGTLKVAANPFGVWTFGPPDRPNFFGTPADKDGWRVGTNHHLPRMAALMAMAYRYQPDPRYLAFVYDQLNWILGGNPFDVSLMEGVGSAFVPTYHNRLIFGGVPRGAVPGSVINGITCRSAGRDVPYLDMSGVDLPSFEANECWLPHNTNYLNAIANLLAAKRKVGGG